MNPSEDKIISETNEKIITCEDKNTKVVEDIKANPSGGKNKKERKLGKRKWEPKQVFEDEEHQPADKQKKEWQSRKKKVAMMLAYSGKDYFGMQRNPGYPTIESCLLDALVKAEVVRPEQIEQPGVKMAFQRAARTDKAVSAAGQVVSFKMLVDIDDAINKINSFLPDHIRVFGTKRTTKTFDSKNSCSSRTYSYLSPTFAFAPVEYAVTQDYRVTKPVLEKIQQILTLFCGTHNFHNFTSGKASSDRSAFRYITSFTVSEAFVRESVEYVLLSVQGQSFMMHQIRKMIGLTMAISRGFVGLEYIKQAWMANKIDIPKAPGLGLMLEKVHYDGYNKRFGADGLHDNIDWSECQKEINEFKEKFIYSVIYATENQQTSMMKWLGTLNIHNYGLILGHAENKNALMDAMMLAKNHGVNKEAAAAVRVDGGGSDGVKDGSVKDGDNNGGSVGEEGSVVVKEIQKNSVNKDERNENTKNLSETGVCDEGKDSVKVMTKDCSEVDADISCEGGLKEKKNENNVSNNLN